MLLPGLQHGRIFDHEITSISVDLGWSDLATAQKYIRISGKPQQPLSGRSTTGEVGLMSIAFHRAR